MMMHQAPMLSAPLKQTNEIDWIHPLKSYIRDSYGDDPERYSEECTMLNRLRQDMRGAGKDSASGRDLLYRYYGQLELLDLRFPVDENHIRISFTWFDAFSLKPTSQYSLAYEKASIIFNISAVLSCHAAVQNRNEEVGLKTAYHSFQAAAGMFTYINENFLHAPSTDLSRDTVKTLIQLMLAQGQEVFLEKQVADQKKVGLLAKLASQAAYLYGQALEGVQENVTKGVFERVWLLVVQVKANHMASLAQYYQAMADNDANAHGIALCRLQVAETQATEAHRIANSFPATIPPISNLTTETSVLLSDITHRHLEHIKEKVTEFSKDNDFIYHQPIPADGTLQTIPKLPAAKAIPVSELYQGQDIQRIIGPDIFQRIVPMAVTESASMYDEEKAKLMRAETERVEVANGELEASLDYLKLPHSLNVLKGGQDMDIGVDPDFRRWCEALSGHTPFASQFDQLKTERTNVNNLLDQCTKSLDMEETVCEKMRSKYGDDWTQQPSSRITGTLRTDIRNYRQVIEEASTNDAQLYSSFRQNEVDFEEMRSAGETDEADVLYQRAMIKAGAGGGKGKPVGNLLNEGNLLDDDFDSGPSVADQIAHIEDLVKKVQLVKKEREQVLKDLRERIHNDDISNILILQKKSLSSDSTQIFRTELEKFRPHTNRLLQANHKQTAILKDLTRTFDTLLMDKRVRADQQKYESFSRSRNSVVIKYKKIFQAYQDLVEGLSRAKQFYKEMKETVESLQSNVTTFVNNRRNEGSQLLTGIEALKSQQSNTSGLVDWERGGLSELMGRMSVEPNKPSQPIPPAPLASRPSYHAAPHSSSSTGGGYTSPPPPPAPPNHQGNHRPANINITPYNPGHHQPLSPPLPGQQYIQQPHNVNRHSQLSFSSPPPQQQQQQQPFQSQSQSQYGQYGGGTSTNQRTSLHQPPQQGQQGGMPAGWQPPPPPPGPPPSQQDYNFGLTQQGVATYPNGPGGYASNMPRQPGQYGSQTQSQQNGNDPWSGLSGWK